MYPSSKTQMGIQLAQQGRRQEALAYLRQAVQTEPPNPEVWLWLAHVSPDINEYRNCVYQALLLDANHPTARQMQSALGQTGAQPGPNPAYGGYSAHAAIPPAAMPAAQTVYGPSGVNVSQPLYADNALINNLERKRNRGRRVRRWAALCLFFGMLISCGVGLRFLFLSEAFEDWFYNLSWFDNSHAVNFTINAADNVTQWDIEVSVPETWLLADERVESWRSTRDRLKSEFALADDTPTIWENVETDVSQIVVDPTNGVVQPPITLIETNADAIRRDGQNVARLQWMQVTPYPQNTQGNDCQKIRALAQVDQTNLQPQAGSQVSYKVQEQDNNRCIYVVHYRNESGTSELIEHVYVLIVPADDGSYAEWQLTVLDQSHTDYENDINKIIETLQVTASINPIPTPENTN